MSGDDREPNTGRVTREARRECGGGCRPHTPQEARPMSTQGKAPRTDLLVLHGWLLHLLLHTHPHHTRQGPREGRQPTFDASVCPWGVGWGWREMLWRRRQPPPPQRLHTTAADGDAHLLLFLLLLLLLLLLFRLLSLHGGCAWFARNRSNIRTQDTRPQARSRLGPTPAPRAPPTPRHPHHAMHCSRSKARCKPCGCGGGGAAASQVTANPPYKPGTPPPPAIQTPARSHQRRASHSTRPQPRRHTTEITQPGAGCTGVQGREGGRGWCEHEATHRHSMSAAAPPNNPTLPIGMVIIRHTDGGGGNAPPMQCVGGRTAAGCPYPTRGYTGS